MHKYKLKRLKNSVSLFFCVTICAKNKNIVVLDCSLFVLFFCLPELISNQPGFK